MSATDSQTPTTDARTFYAAHGAMTDPRENCDMLTGLPSGVAELRDVTQGVMIHIFHAQMYGVELNDERRREVEICRVVDMLARISELDERPVRSAREAERRLVANCRDFAVFLTALLRKKGVPARARCGFESYFTPGKHCDHWISEYWNADDERWVRVDAQIDDAQRAAFGLEFDALDLPPGAFLSGGEAWNLCRTGAIDADDCGLHCEEGMHGMWFVRDNLLRDLMALNKFEVMPWDRNQAMGDRDIGSEESEFLDHLAALTTGGDATYREVRAQYESDPSLRMPAKWNP